MSWWARAAFELCIPRDLFFPDKKPKEIIEAGGDDNIKDDLDSGGKKDEGDVKVIVCQCPTYCTFLLK